MADKNPGNDKNDFQIPRMGESGLPPFRTERIFVVSSSWYFKTREGTEQGPFMNRDIAEQAINVYIEDQQRDNRRLFSIGDNWYFSTREGVDQGPFACRESAEQAIQDYIKQQKSHNNVFRLPGYNSIFKKS